MMLLKILLPILLGVHLAAADRASRSSRQHKIVITTVNDTEMKMECTLRSHRVKEASWTKDGQDIPLEPERMSIRNGYLTINPVLPKDEGTYSCNGGRSFKVTIPPYNNRTTEVSVMKDLGSNFTIPCGIVLGLVSQDREYEVMWQLIVGTRFEIIGRCHHTDLSMLDSPETLEDCSSERYSIDQSSFSLTVFNFDILGLMIDPSVPEVKYQCTVQQMFRPEFNGDVKINSANTTVSFHFEPAEITLSLPQYVVVQRGESVELDIEFVGHPLSPEGVQWEVNGRALPKNLSSDTLTSSSLSLSGDNVELGDRIDATVHVYSNSTASTNTTVVIIPTINDVIMKRPSMCSEPVLSFKIPAPLPISPGSPESPNIQLYIEYTRIDAALASTATEKEVVHKLCSDCDTSILTKSTQMEVQITSLGLPYHLMRWEIYVVRVRLQVLGVTSEHWSAYSPPVCTNCEDCLNPPGVKLNLHLSFPERSYICNNTVIDKIREDIVQELVHLIQKSCPEYLCQDLVLTEVSVTCSTTDNAAMEFSALASGVRTQDTVRAFLQNLQEPLNLSINGTSVQATPTTPPTTPPTSSTPKTDIGPIVAYSTCGFMLVLLIVVVASSCALYHWKRKHKEHSMGSSGERRFSTRPESDQQMPAPRRLGSSDVFHQPSHRNGNGHLQTPTPEDEVIPIHRTTMMPQQGLCHLCHSSPSPHPLTMAEAGGIIAQLEDNLDDTSSVDLSNYPHSEYSFISERSTPSPHPNLRPLPLSSATQIPKPFRETPVPHGHRSPHASCSCSCHSSDLVSLPSPSPSVPLLNPGRQRSQRRPTQSPTLALSQPTNFQHHYNLWTERGPHYHLPNRFSPVSPV